MLKRELSCFLCRELLYEHVSKSIDSRRGEAVAMHLVECKECQHEQEGFQRAISYSQKLASIELRPEYFAEISNPIPVKQLLAKRLGWKSWPDPLRWTVESLAFAGIIAIFVGTLGQQLFRGNSNSGNVQAVEHPTETIDVAQLPDQTPTEFGDEEFTDHVSEGEGTQLSAAPQPLEKRMATPEPDIKVVQAEQEIAQNNAVAPSNASESAAAKNQNGFLYRTTFKVANLEKVTEEIVNKIEGLGGKKAGEVPLGWKRPNGSYFHFSMTESNYSQLSDFLKKFGGPMIVKEKNPRVMPTGTIRMILEVESAHSTANVPESATEPESPSPSTPTSESTTDAQE